MLHDVPNKTFKHPMPKSHHLHSPEVVNRCNANERAPDSPYNTAESGHYLFIICVYFAKSMTAEQKIKAKKKHLLLPLCCNLCGE